jgi:hypothetical protein
MKWLKDLELENSRLWKAVSDSTLDKRILQEAITGKSSASSRLRRAYSRAFPAPFVCGRDTTKDVSVRTEIIVE